MIESARDRKKSEAAGGWEREDTYALRRALVRRLQASTRGVPRRDRVAAWRNFAEAWREAVSEGRLAEFSGILKGERALGSEVGVLGRIAAGLDVDSLGTPRTSGVFQPATFLQREGAVPRESRTQSEPNRGGRAETRSGGRQVELFAPGLVAQPL